MPILPDQNSKESPMSRPLPRRINPSPDLSPEQVSQAWQYLSSLQPPSSLNPEHPPPPENLQHLSDADWFLLSNLLLREMYLKERSPLQ